MKNYVGLDVSMKETFICVEDQTGAIVHQNNVKTDPDIIAKALLDLGVHIEKVGLESGSLSHWLVEGLKKFNIPVICIDARKMATLLSFQINKTDKNDAKGIAQAMRTEMYRAVAHKSENSVELSTLMNSRKLLVEQKTQITNTIRGLLKPYGILLGSVGAANFSRTVKEVIGDRFEIAKNGIEALLNTYDTLLSNLKKLEKDIGKLAKTSEEAKLLKTIPGVGNIVAMNYLSEIDGPKRFKNAKAVGAYLGMTPRQYSSGDIKKQGRISKCGSSEMRALLNEAAVVLLTRSKKWSKLKAWGLKIKRKHGFKKAAMAVGRKLAVIMLKMLINKTEFIYGEPKEKEQKEKSLQTKSYCKEKVTGKVVRRTTD